KVVVVAANTRLFRDCAVNAIAFREAVIIGHIISYIAVPPRLQRLSDALRMVQSDRVLLVREVRSEMDKNRVKGKVKDIAGRAQRQAGEWTGNEKGQAKGAAKQVEGKLQK